MFVSSNDLHKSQIVGEIKEIWSLWDTKEAFEVL